LRKDAAAFFYPFGVIYHRTPPGIDVVVPDDARRLIAAAAMEEHLHSREPLPPAAALLANPSDAAVTLVWDPPRDERVTSYEARWRPARARDWQSAAVSLGNRWTCAGLENGTRYVLQLRALAPGLSSAWTPEVSCVPGPVRSGGVGAMAARVRPWTLLKLAGYGLLHGFVTRFRLR
jgi:hypothetical protein